MPTIKYPKNPNVDTAFVEQEDGTQNRALMVAPQDISTLELPNNPNSTKGYVTIDGNKQRVVLTAQIAGEGGGSSLPDQTGHSGEFLTTDGTDASWAAVDALPSQTGNSGKFLTTDGTDASWAAVDALPSQTGNSGKFLTTDGTDASWAAVDALPSQTGNAGKFLTTDGTDASWSNKVIVSSASESGISISSTNTNTAYRRITIGNGTAAAGKYGVAVGYNAQTGESGVAIGNTARANGSCSFAAGEGATTTNYGIAIGCENKTTANYAIQIGGTYKTNSDANTFKVGNQNGNYEMMSANGTIPTDRFTTTPVADGTYVPTLTISSGVATRSWSAPGGGSTAATGTLVAANWSSSSQTINVTGVTASNNVIVAPAPASQADYTAAGIICTAQGAGTLTFTCTSTPSSDLTVNVLII